MAKPLFILVTRPDHDLPTKYLYFWAQLLITAAKKIAFGVIDLKHKKANLQSLIKGLNKKPVLVFLNGHGSKDCLTGYQNQPLLGADNNESIVSNTIVYACSCETAALLGEKCVQAGTVAYFGYKEPMYLCYSASKTKKPLQDKLAALFLDPSNLIPLSLLNKQTTKEAYGNSQTAMTNNLQYMLSTKATKTQRDAAPYLWSNIKYQVLLGQKNAKILATE
jgi:hypothetical protein